MMTDPIADFLTRIRNATLTHHRRVEIPGSNMKKKLAEILKDEGFIEDFSWTEDGKQGVLHLTLKYDENGSSVIEGLKRESKPGRRNYCSSEDIPRVRSGLGIVVMSTSRGVITGRDARSERVGGEVLCSVW